LWPGGDILAREPALWTAQGFDVVMPAPADFYRMVADQQARVGAALRFGARPGKRADLNDKSQPNHQCRSGRSSGAAGCRVS